MAQTGLRMRKTKFPSPEEREYIKWFAEISVQSGVLPDSIKWKLTPKFDNWGNCTREGVETPKDVQMAMVSKLCLKAFQLDIDYQLALEELHFVKGRIGMEAQLMLSLIKSRVDSKITIIEMSLKRVVILAERWRQPLRDGAEVIYEKEEMAYTQQDAIQSGKWLLTPGQEMSEYDMRSPWFKHPIDMLWAKCVGRIGRRMFPDVIQGCYTVDDLVDIKANEIYGLQASGEVLSLPPTKETPTKRLPEATSIKPPLGLPMQTGVVINEDDFFAEENMSPDERSEIKPRPAPIPAPAPEPKSKKKKTTRAEALAKRKKKAPVLNIPSNNKTKIIGQPKKEKAKEKKKGPTLVLKGLGLIKDKKMSKKEKAPSTLPAKEPEVPQKDYSKKDYFASYTKAGDQQQDYPSLCFMRAINEFAMRLGEDKIDIKEIERQWSDLIQKSGRRPKGCKYLAGALYIILDNYIEVEQLDLDPKTVLALFKNRMNKRIRVGLTPLVKKLLKEGEIPLADFSLTLAKTLGWTQSQIAWAFKFMESRDFIVVKGDSVDLGDELLEGEEE
jgi:hypothetical protein